MLLRLKTVTRRLFTSTRVGIIMGASQSTNADTSTASSPYARGLETPNYIVTVGGDENGCEVRQYEPSKWIATTITGTDRKAALYSCFMLLFKYISGTNQGNQKVAMTTPVLAKVVPGQIEGESNFTVGFFVPFEFHDNAPAPTNPDLAFLDLPAMTVYVKSFGGYESNEKVVQHLEELKKKLVQENKEYVKNCYYTAGYDPPYRIFGRHNEVWLQAVNCKSE